jgi:hypothetical protein
MKADDIFNNDFSTKECEITKIIRDHLIIIDQWIVNNEGSIDVNGNVAFPSHIKNLSKIPLRFNKVTGDFDCSGLGLKTLEDCPMEVGGTFDCTYNQLLSLDNAPKKVAGAFMFDDTVKSIYTGISCDYNEVVMFYRTKNIEMIGLPKIIIENAVHLPIIFKYLEYYCNDDKSFNEENMIDLIEDIMDGLT